MTYLTPLRAVCAIALGASSPVFADGEPRYTVTDLGPLSGDFGASSTADAINNKGEVAGRSEEAPDQYVSTLWLPSPAYGFPAGPVDLGDLGVVGGRAYGINDHGQTVGFVPPPGGGGWATACLWDPATGISDLGSFGGTHSIANAINNSGLVVGESDAGDSTTFRAAFLWDGARLNDLGAFEAGAFELRAEDINELGQVAGHSMYLDNPQQPDNSRLHAFLWLPEPAYGLPAGLNDLDDYSVEDFQISTAKGLNDRGQTVIWGSNPIAPGFYLTHVAFWLWLPEADYGLSAGINDLRGPYGIASTAFGQDLNNRGEVVFRANIDPENPFGVWRAMLWRQGDWFDLIECVPPNAQAIWSFESATDINERGEISGWGFRSGVLHGFKLTPVTDDPAPCDADISGDGTVDTVDLLALLAGWGGGEGPADINNDGAVDVLDLLDLLAAWGPCEPLGACCFAYTGDCQPLTAVDCDFMDGTWNAGASCDDFTCPAPEQGACCFFPSGTCEDIGAFECDVAGGAWEGASTTCASVACPQPLPGEWIGNAIVVPAVPYATAGDTSPYNNDYDEQCDELAQAPDVVYAYTPLVDEIVSISLCDDSAYDTKLYVYEDDEYNTIACNDDRCTTPSFPDFAYVSFIEGLELTAGHTYYIVVDGWGLERGPYTLDIESMGQACCLPNGECNDLPEGLCNDLGGTWFGDETCATFTCPPLPTGACCLPDGNCLAAQTEWDCENIFGGTWQGEGVSCFAVNCP